MEFENEVRCEGDMAKQEILPHLWRDEVFSYLYTAAEVAYLTREREGRFGRERDMVCSVT